MCGVATFLQLQLHKHFGVGLPVVLGISFQSVAALTIIGQSHGSGAMFGALIVSLQGMQMLANVDFANNEHNFLIAAVSIAVGVGFNNSNLFNSFPTELRMFFSNGIVMASLLAVILNAILNRKKK